MKKILFIGPEVTDFLNPLAKNLKALGHIVDLMENRKVPRNSKVISESYSKVYDYNKISHTHFTVLIIIKYLVKVEFYKAFFRTLLVNFLENDFRIIKSLRNSFTYQRNREIFSSIFEKYDVISFQSLNPGTLLLVEFVKPHTKIILSFWGSDLFKIWGTNDDQVASTKDYFIELDALKRADAITVHSYEMERVVMAKYGPAMKNKIIQMLFGIQDVKFDLIDCKIKTGIDHNFLEKHNIPGNKIKITIGYSADPICNHISILDELSKLKTSLKKEIHLLVPLTYGNVPEEYLLEIKHKLDTSQVTYTIFEEFLTLDDLLNLRVTSDIMVMMNKSDALSASVTEAIYSENLLISAIWLPYSPYRNLNIYFYETDFLHLADKISYAVSNYEMIKPSLNGNPAKVRKLTAFSENYPRWLRIFNNL